MTVTWVIWSGPAPDARTKAALAARAIRIAGGAHTDGNGNSASPVCEIVAATGRGGPPRPTRPELPWLWLAPTRPPATAATAAVVAGAYDVVDGDGAPDDVVARLAERIGELAVAETAVPADGHFIAESPASRAVLRQIAQAARTSMPVLFTGETGTGKEVGARLVHAWSARSARPFVPINCAAIPNELIEAELFGYTKGAFTGSVRAYPGQLMAAEGGTVMLDEVDDTPLPFQVKLLRVLEDRVVSQLGENVWRKVDFRILAATNRDLVPLCASGAFGADLYERLAIVSIRLPPLRERIEDLPLLARHFIGRFYEEEPVARQRHLVAEVAPPALAAMNAYPWPGNVRELRNVIFEALVNKRAGTSLLLSDLPRRVLHRETAEPNGRALINTDGVARAIRERRFDLRAAMMELERAALAAALVESSGNAAAAARLLGRVGRGSARDPGGTTRAMMRRLGMSGTDSAAAGAGALPSPVVSRRARRRRR